MEMGENFPEIKKIREKSGFEKEYLGKFRRGLKKNLEVLKSDETEEEGKLIKMMMNFFDEKEFLEEIFPKWKKEFWERQRNKIPLPKNAVEQSRLWNTTSPPLSGKIMDGFKSIGWIPNRGTEVDEHGIPSFGKRKSEIVIVDKEKDDKLAKLCAWARGLEERFPDEERRAFVVAMEVFERMGGRMEEENQGKEDLPEWSGQFGKEFFLGDIKKGYCRHRSPLFHVLAQEAGLDSFWNRWSLAAEGYGAAEAHDDIWVFLSDGRIIIVDAMHPPAGIDERRFGMSFDNLSYKEFKEKGGFPVVFGNRMPFSNYCDRDGRFSAGRGGVILVEELLKAD